MATERNHHLTIVGIAVDIRNYFLDLSAEQLRERDTHTQIWTWRDSPLRSRLTITAHLPFEEVKWYMYWTLPHALPLNWIVQIWTKWLGSHAIEIRRLSSCLVSICKPVIRIVIDTLVAQKAWTLEPTRTMPQHCMQIEWATNSHADSNGLCAMVNIEIVVWFFFFCSPSNSFRYCRHCVAALATNDRPFTAFLFFSYAVSKMLCLRSQAVRYNGIRPKFCATKCNNSIWIIPVEYIFGTCAVRQSTRGDVTPQ